MTTSIMCDKLNIFVEPILDNSLVSPHDMKMQRTFTPNDPAACCYLSNMEIQHEMGGEKWLQQESLEILQLSKLLHQWVNWLECITQSLLGFVTSSTKDVLDVDSHIVNGRWPLKYLLGFEENYTKDVLNVKQELFIILSYLFPNSYIGRVDAVLEITKMNGGLDI